MTMNLNRRQFLSALFGTAAAAMVANAKPLELVLDPELALWSPGAKTIFIPEAKILRPEAPTVFDDCIDLDRALRDPAYFASQVIGQDIIYGGRHIDHAEYLAKYPPQRSAFNAEYWR